MRTAKLALATFAFAAVFAAGAANAESYKWCAVYGGSGAAPTNCGFATLEQCRATVSGMGGYCAVNSFYTGAEKRKPHRG